VRKVFVFKGICTWGGNYCWWKTLWAATDERAMFPLSGLYALITDSVYEEVSFSTFSLPVLFIYQSVMMTSDQFSRGSPGKE